MAYLFLVFIFASGCFFETSDDLPFGQSEPIEIQEKQVPLFDPEQVPTGMVCAHDFTKGAVCDPVLQDCPKDQYCSLTIDTEINRARAVCVPRPATTLKGKQGEACEGSCAVGFRCVLNVCLRICELQSGFGCEEDQFCDDPFPGTHGVCGSTCR